MILVFFSVVNKIANDYSIRVLSFKFNYFRYKNIFESNFHHKISERTEIIAIAQTYSVGSIVLPKLEDMREQVQSEIQSKAEQKSDLVEVQQKYAKHYRVSVHQWSYGRLIANIQSQAQKAGIVIEEGKQPIRASPQEKAKELAINAYKSRKA